MVAARPGIEIYEFAPRGGLDIFGVAKWIAAVQQIDWNRVLLETKGRHLQHAGEEDVCGQCLQSVLLDTQMDL